MRPTARCRTPGRIMMHSAWLNRQPLAVQLHIAVRLALQKVIRLGEPFVVVGPRTFRYLSAMDRAGKVLDLCESAPCGSAGTGYAG